MVATPTYAQEQLDYIAERGNTLRPEYAPRFETIDLADQLEGQRRRDEGIGTVDLAEGVIWKSKADAAIQLLADSGESFTADDVRRIAGDPRHPNAMGARLLKASRRGLIVCVGRRQSTRAECHAHANPLWRAA